MIGFGDGLGSRPNGGQAGGTPGTPGTPATSCQPGEVYVAIDGKMLCADASTTTAWSQLF